MDQWDGVECPERAPYIDHPSIFDKGAEARQLGKGQPFQQILIVRLDIICNRYEPQPVPRTTVNKN